jgi:hypothetical protein
MDKQLRLTFKELKSIGFVKSKDRRVYKIKTETGYISYDTHDDFYIHHAIWKDTSIQTALNITHKPQLYPVLNAFFVNLQ